MKRLVVGVLAHVDSGKTTLSEALLYRAGSIRKLGRVDHRDAFLDTDALEKARGITIFAKQAVLTLPAGTVTGTPLEETQITLLDTPGHVDFSAEAERTLQVLDYAVLVISGADGVQGHTETLWSLLKRYRVPTFLFINKMDQPGTEQEVLLSELQKRLSESCVDFALLDGQKENVPEEVWETIAMSEEELLEQYLENGSIPEQEIRRLIRQRKLFPCYFGSALKLKGVEELLNGLERWMGEINSDQDAAFGAKVFKISRDEQGSRLTHLKITSGRLKLSLIHI